MSIPSLPAELSRSGKPSRTASTPTEYWNLVGAGYTVSDSEENLTPQQKAARTRAANKAKESENTSNDGDLEPDGTGESAGNATGDES